MASPGRCRVQGSAGRARGRAGCVHKAREVACCMGDSENQVPIENPQEGTTDTEQLQERGEGPRSAEDPKPKGKAGRRGSVEKLREGCSPRSVPGDYKNWQQGWLRRRVLEGGGGRQTPRPSTFFPQLFNKTKRAQYY